MVGKVKGNAIVFGVRSSTVCPKGGSSLLIESDTCAHAFMVSCNYMSTRKANARCWKHRWAVLRSVVIGVRAKV